MAKLPTVRSRRLGARMRDYRKAAEFDQVTTAQAVGISQGYLSKFENGDAKAGQQMFNTLCTLFGVPVSARGELDELRVKAEQSGWWQAYSDITPAPVQTLIELEQEASGIRTYEGSVIPGLLQTRQYAMAVNSAFASSHVRVDEIDRHVELRMHRQQRIIDGKLQVTAVLSEAAIRQQVGGREVLHGQLQHLMKLATQHDVVCQVLPFTAGAHPALGDQFVVIQWPRTEDPEAVYVDGLTSHIVHEDPGSIRRYSHAFAAVQNQSLPPRDSLELIDKVREELEQ